MGRSTSVSTHVKTAISFYVATDVAMAISKFCIGEFKLILLSHSSNSNFYHDGR